MFFLNFVSFFITTKFEKTCFIQSFLYSIFFEFHLLFKKAVVKNKSVFKSSYPDSLLTKLSFGTFKSAELHLKNFSLKLPLESGNFGTPETFFRSLPEALIISRKQKLILKAKISLGTMQKKISDKLSSFLDIQEIKKNVRSCPALPYRIIFEAAHWPQFKITSPSVS